MVLVSLVIEFHVSPPLPWLGSQAPLVEREGVVPALLRWYNLKVITHYSSAFPWKARENNSSLPDHLQWHK
jgi:hypothetical protein